jgi:parallel beta-helix repeat protein
MTDSMRRLIGFSISFICAIYANAGDIYVAADAALGGDGSKQAPYSSLAQARDGIRAARKTGAIAKQEAVTVRLQPGIYRQRSTFKLSAEDGGSPDSPVVYRAEQPGTVRIEGGVRLQPSAFQAVTDSQILSRLSEEARGKVLRCDIGAVVPGEFKALKTAYKGAPVAPCLYVNHRPMTLARWPNAGWARFSKAVDTGLAEPNASDPNRHKARPGSFGFGDSRPTRWNLEEGVWLFGYWKHDWSNEVIRLAAYDQAAQVLSLAAPHHYGIGGGTWGNQERRFFALNSLDELDAPGEWYLDRTQSLLYLYPEDDLKTAEIALATLTEPLLSVSRAAHIRLEGLSFEYSHGVGIHLQNTEHVEVASCSLSNLAARGIQVTGSNNTVRSCELFNLGTAGISLSGGDRKTLVPARNLAENNHIHHFARFQRTYAPGISVSGCGQIVRNNCIHDAPHSAMLYNGNEHLFERNEIYRVVLETGDAGAFYTGRDWTSQGNVLRHNYIHDLGQGETQQVNTMGVYLDDCDSGDTIEGNIFYRAGRAIMIGGGRSNRVLNNIVVDCPIGLHMDSRGMTWKQWNDPKSSGWGLEEKAERLNYREPPWSERYPKLAVIMSDSPQEPLHNSIRRNVFVDCSKQVCNFDANVKKLVNKIDLADNLSVNTTGTAKNLSVGIPGFISMSGSETDPIALGFGKGAKPNFSRLAETFPSLEPIPFEAIGLLKKR